MKPYDRNDEYGWDDESVLFYAPEDKPAVMIVFLLVALSGAFMGAAIASLVWWLT